MPEVSEQTGKRSRKIHTAILQALAELSQTRVADLMGASESTVCHIKNEKLVQLSNFLAACGLKVVPESAAVYDDAYINSLRHLASIGIHAPAPRVGGDE